MPIWRTVFSLSIHSVPRHIHSGILQPHDADLCLEVDTVLHEDLPDEDEPCCIGLGKVSVQFDVYTVLLEKECEQTVHQPTSCEGSQKT